MNKIIKLFFINLLIGHSIETIDLSKSLSSLEVTFMYLSKQYQDYFKTKIKPIADLFHPEFQKLDLELTQTRGKLAPENPTTYYSAHIGPINTAINKLYQTLTPEEAKIATNLFHEFMKNHIKPLLAQLELIDISNRLLVSVFSRFICPVFKETIEKSLLLEAPQINELVSSITLKQEILFYNYLNNTNWLKNPGQLFEAASIDQALGDLYHYQKLINDDQVYKDTLKFLEGREKALKFAQEIPSWLSITTLSLMQKAIDDMTLGHILIKTKLRIDPQKEVTIRMSSLSADEISFMFAAALPKFCTTFGTKAGNDKILYGHIINYIYDTYIIRLPAKDRPSQLFNIIDLCLDTVSKFLKPGMKDFNKAKQALKKHQTAFKKSPFTFDENVLKPVIADLQKTSLFAQPKELNDLINIFSGFEKTIISILKQKQKDILAMSEDDREKNAVQITADIDHLKNLRLLYRSFIAPSLFFDNSQEINKIENTIKTSLQSPLSKVKQKIDVLSKLIPTASIPNFAKTYQFDIFLTPTLQEIINDYEKLDPAAQNDLTKRITTFYQDTVKDLEDQAKKFDPGTKNDEKTIKFIAIVTLIKELISNSTPKLMKSGNVYNELLKKLTDIIENRQSDPLKEIDNASEWLDNYIQRLQTNYQKYYDDPHYQGKKMIEDHHEAFNLATQTINTIEKIANSALGKRVHNYFNLKVQLKNQLDRLNPIPLVGGKKTTNNELFAFYTDRLSKNKDEANMSFKSAQQNYNKSKIGIKYKGAYISIGQAYTLLGVSPGATKGQINKAFIKKTRGMDQNDPAYRDLQQLRSDLIAYMSADDIYKRAQTIYNDQLAEINQAKNSLTDLQNRYYALDQKINKLKPIINAM